MRASTAATRRASARTLATQALLVACACVLAGCTSGEGGAGPAGGQSPDPVVLDFPIAYVKRPVPVGDDLVQDARDLLEFRPGADLWVRKYEKGWEMKA